MCAMRSCKALTLGSSPNWSSPTGAAAMAEQIGKRLRVDEAQQLTTTQKTAVEQTLNLGDTATDFVAAFNQALK